jgi:hydroxymethylbilane synthase
VRELCAPIADPATARVLVAERALVRALGADCHTPVGALAQESAHALEVEAFVGLPDGSAWVRDRLSGPRDDPGALGREVAERMLAAGAGELLERARAGRPAA